MGPVRCGAHAHPAPHRPLRRGARTGPLSSPSSCGRAEFVPGPARARHGRTNSAPGPHGLVPWPPPALGPAPVVRVGELVRQRPARSVHRTSWAPRYELGAWWLAVGPLYRTWAGARPAAPCDQRASSAEGGGFEPPEVSLSGFQDRHIRPLCQPSVPGRGRAAPIVAHPRRAADRGNPVAPARTRWVASPTTGPSTRTRLPIPTGGTAMRATHALVPLRHLEGITRARTVAQSGHPRPRRRR